MRATSRAVASRAGVVQEDVTVEMRSAVERRILIAHAQYAFGAHLCVSSTYVSTPFIVLVQLNYAFALRIKPLYRLCGNPLGPTNAVACRRTT